MPAAWEPFVRICDEHRRFLLTTHTRADGDGLGCEIALHRYLKRRGKDAVIVNHEPVPEKLAFLDRRRLVKVADTQALASGGYDGFEVLVSLDNSYRHRLGELAALCDRTDLVKVAIDHHVFRGTFADVAVVDESTACVGEMLFDFFRQQRVKLDHTYAQALYVSLVTDTGYFSYPNTSASAHLMAAELLQHKIDPTHINGLIYQRNTLAQAKLLGLAMHTLHTDLDGRLAWFSVSHADADRAGVDADDTEFFVDFVRQLEAVEVIAFFRHVARGTVNVSLRSKGEVNVEPVAKAYGGGGHATMAGMQIKGPFKKTVADVVAALKRAMTRAT
ncbi:MAG: bifunctional oligoribonuclease/PAP phosphatase NrnA [Verrucomicrobia bacterium]|nr:bifunctional oligoribonuclease/PAP phosphatase NrnA [Verrucomicrobiota bacterium]